MKQRNSAFIDVRARRTAITRLSVMMVLFMAIGVVILFKTGDLQLNRREELQAQARRNSARTIPIPPVRGSILDRNGKPLAVDVPAFRLVSIKENGTWEEKPVSFEEASRQVETGDDETYIETISTRKYPTGATASHVVGYTGIISADEFRKLEQIGYVRTDLVGKSGLEKTYERKLFGTRGRKLLSVDSRGIFMDETSGDRALGTAPLRTSLDIDIQSEAYQALMDKGKPGAVIVMESDSGAIVAMATYPSFDNNLAVGGFPASEWKRLQEDESHPMINRAISISSPIGSVIKPMMAAAALNEGVVDVNRKFYCPGYFRLGNRTFKCWQSGGHGSLNIVDGIAHSCDVVFYTIGLELGVTKIKKYAKMFGLGRKTGLDLPGESIGTVPDPEWKKQFRNDSWYEGDTVNMSIGQGFVQASPIQVLVMANVVATRGKVVTPHVAGGGMVPEPGRVDVSLAALETSAMGMRQAVLKGTSVGMLRLPLASGGKTGTADDPPREDPHAWYIGFAPFDKPRLTFMVFVENGGHGSSDALPIARRVLGKAIEKGWFPAAPEPDIINKVSFTEDREID